MASLLERELVLVTGKGGTGKTTMACALGLLAARRGRRTLVIEVGEQRRAPALLAPRDGGRSGDRFRLDGREARTPGQEARTPGQEARTPGQEARTPGQEARTPGQETRSPVQEARTPGLGEELQVGENLWATSIDPDRAMIEWLRAVTGRAPARILAASSTFRYFAAAAPGAKELVTMVKLLDLSERYDLLVMDAPATGHALGMLRSPQTFSAIARVGPLSSRSDMVRALLGDPERSGYVAVAEGSEMAVTETLELEESLRRLLDRDLDAVIVNGVLPRRFTREEMGRVAELDSSDGEAAGGASRKASGRASGEAAIVRAAAGAARAAYVRARTQQSQIARLRRQRFAEGKPAKVLTIPFEFTSALDAEAVEGIADRLGRSL